MDWNKFRRMFLLIAALSLVATSQAAFLNNTFGGTDTLVNFDQYVAFTPLGSTPLQVYDDGNGFSMDVSDPSDVVSAGVIYYGFDTTHFTNALVNESSAAQTAPAAVEFTLAGGAVSAIGIRLSALSGYDHTAITLEVFNASDVLLETFSFVETHGGGISPLNPTPQGGFFGFDLGSGNADIVRFRISGGTVLLDDLRFGGLEAATSGGGDPDPEPEPEPGAVPEPGTFLLCSAALLLLSVAGRKRLGRKTA